MEVDGEEGRTERNIKNDKWEETRRDK